MVSADNTLYAVDAGFGWYSVDTNTGVFTYIRDRPSQYGRFFAAYEIPQVPEPSTLLLVGTAAIGLGHRFRKQA